MRERLISLGTKGQNEKGCVGQPYSCRRIQPVCHLDFVVTRRRLGATDAGSKGLLSQRDQRPTAPSDSGEMVSGAVDRFAKFGLTEPINGD
jgi:hypothetical protein